MIELRMAACARLYLLPGLIQTPPSPLPPSFSLFLLLLLFGNIRVVCSKSTVDQRERGNGKQDRDESALWHLNQPRR